jgi:membrane-anchored protein YejM (alkaline phosphatase superfamily)
MLTEFNGSQDFLLFTLDSCRWDVFDAARMPNLKSLCRFRKAYTQGTYTYPAHISMFSGQFPNVIENEPYYNRFNKYLFLIRGGNATINSYVEFPRGTPNILHGFGSIGYNTFGIGAVEWFRHPNLYGPFREFIHSGIHLSKQIELLLEKASANAGRPFFGFVNIGETHDPYEFGGHIAVTARKASLMRLTPGAGFARQEYLKQIRCCEYIDGQFGKIIEFARRSKRRTVFIVCGDHGECFGEDGMYGHGFFHQKVMEVPMGIFEI